MNPTTYLTEKELNHAYHLLEHYPEAQAGIDVLKRHRGNPKTSVEELAGGNPSFQVQSLVVVAPKSIWEILLEQLYLDVCGSNSSDLRQANRNSLRKILNESQLHPESAALLSGAVVYLVHLSGVAISPAVATVLVLYVLHLGINVFCEYTAQFRTS
ncbi:MAG: hypothetical protein KME43_07140 [Myxacorys chilensis ATA2-1-KO14]|nr:hypothetical protein [Myxacorys chilensis ATA2-1-KO14]